MFYAPKKLNKIEKVLLGLYNQQMIGDHVVSSLEEVVEAEARLLWAN